MTANRETVGSAIARDGTSRAHALSRSRLVLFWLVLCALAWLVLELGAMVAVHLLPLPRGFIWNPNLAVVRASWSEQTSTADEELGWPPPKLAVVAPRDSTGAKMNAEFPDAGKACGSAYGDSFVWGEDVPLADGWVEQLSRILGCRVSNYGVSYYGMDQAYLRFRQAADDSSPVAMLGVFPDDLIRNVNQYRGFFGGEPKPFWVKGRFLLTPSGELEWIKRPRLDIETYLRLHREPASVLPDEYFLPDTRDGPTSAVFPYSVRLMRLLLSYRVRNRILLNQTPYSDFYDAEHPSKTIALGIAIAEAFVRNAEQRKKIPLIIMLPGAGSFRVAAFKGEPDYASFVVGMHKRGIEVFDTLSALKQKLKGRSYCELYIDQRKCNGHFSVVGNALVAEVVAEELRRRNLVDYFSKALRNYPGNGSLGMQ